MLSINSIVDLASSLIPVAHNSVKFLCIFHIFSWFCSFWSRSLDAEIVDASTQCTILSINFFQLIDFLPRPSKKAGTVSGHILIILSGFSTCFSSCP